VLGRHHTGAPNLKDILSVVCALTGNIYGERSNFACGGSNLQWVNFYPSHTSNL